MCTVLNLTNFNLTKLKKHMEPFIGQIIMVGFGYAPRGWALCDGRLLSVATNSALFAVLGTTYGGDGQSTFALPDLRGRCAVGMGQGPGLSNYAQGEAGGVESVALNQAQIPMHTHSLMASNSDGATSDPTAGVIAVNKVVIDRSNTVNGSAFVSSAPNISMHPQAILPVGSNMAHENRSPYLAMNYAIALTGIYPTRD
jgi:microcystin-dependent protein